MIDIETISVEAEAMYDWLSSVRRNFHRYPETGLQEFHTRQKIISYLNDMNIQYDDHVFATAVTGVVSGGPGRVVALRADMDALTIREENEVEYKSCNEGIMHACGHDAHMAVVLGTARLLTKYRGQLPGSLKLFFQPAEETTGGAQSMIAAGCMKNPAVDYALALHVSADYEAGTIALKYGQNCAATDEIEITVTGKSAHGAHPGQGIDAIVIAAQIISALQTVVSRSLEATDPAVVTIGTIRGGDKANIIAEKVVLGGTVRSLTPGIRKTVLNRIAEISCKTAEAFGGYAAVKVIEGYLPLVNDTFVIDTVQRSAVQILGNSRVTVYNIPSLGGEDFSCFAEAVPSAMFRLGIKNSEKGIVAGIHNNRFDIDEKALVTGVKVLALSALRLMEC